MNVFDLAKTIWVEPYQNREKFDVAWEEAAPQLRWDEKNEPCAFCAKPLAYARTVWLVGCQSGLYRLHPACREDFIAKELYVERSNG